MKAGLGVLLVWTILHTTAFPDAGRAPGSKEQQVPEAKQTEQKQDVLAAAAADARKAYQQAQQEAERTWKIATQIRERDDIIDPEPHRESVPLARSGKPEDVKAYLEAKRIYLKANLESAAKGDLASEAMDAANADVSRLLDAERKLIDAARTKATQTYNAAATLRKEHDIRDPDPEGEVADVSSLSGNREDVRAYLAAKAEYLKAKAELNKLPSIACRITDKDLEVMMRRSTPESRPR